eukprot:15481369-Alexandrium_andersonii.AAC.1
MAAAQAVPGAPAPRTQHKQQECDSRLRSGVCSPRPLAVPSPRSPTFTFRRQSVISPGILLCSPRVFQRLRACHRCRSE